MSKTNHARSRTDGFRKIKQVPSDVRNKRNHKQVENDFDVAMITSTKLVTGVDISKWM